MGPPLKCRAPLLEKSPRNKAVFCGPFLRVVTPGQEGFNLASAKTEPTAPGFYQGSTKTFAYLGEETRHLVKVSTPEACLQNCTTGPKAVKDEDGHVEWGKEGN